MNRFRRFYSFRVKRKHLIYTIILSLSLTLFVSFYDDINGIAQSSVAQGIKSCIFSSDEVDPPLKCDYKPPLVRNNTVLVTFTNSGFLTMTLNWICNVRSKGFQRPLVIGMDPYVCPALKGIADCITGNVPNVTAQAVHYGNSGYRDMMVQRSLLLYQLIDCGYDVLFSDNDIVFFKDPLDYIPKEYDMIMQQDSTGIDWVDTVKIPYACGGFMFIRNNERSKKFWRKVIEIQLNHDKNDQTAINICMWNPFLMKWTTFDNRIFVDGLNYYKKRNYDDENKVIVHSNWLLSLERKEERMKQHRMWFLDKNNNCLLN